MATRQASFDIYDAFSSVRLMAAYLDWSQYLANLVAIAATLIASIIAIDAHSKKAD
jgi:hypothetical protein